MDHLEDLFGSVDAAIYETVSGYVDPVTKQRGASGLAPRVGMVAGVLSNKANPLQDHQLTLRESVPVQLTTNNFQILFAYAAALGHTAFKLPQAENVSDVELLNAYCEVHERMGVLARDIRDTLEDNRIHPSEVQTIRTAFDALVRQGLGFISRLEGLAR